MKRWSGILSGLLLACAMATMTACSSDDDDSQAAGKTPLPRRVVVAYMMGENSLSSAAQSDLGEMRAGMGRIPDDCKFVVFFDNSSPSSMPQILSFDSAGESVVVQYADDVISTDSAAMEQALRSIVDAFPAEEYALILWSHGSGWMPASKKTIGIDNGANTTSNSGTEMEIPTLRRVLENVGVEWRYVFFDACFMQCVEVAYELRNVADWIIASPAEIPGDGADYTALMPYFFEASDFARDIAEQYYNIYRGNYGLLISSVETSRLDDLAQATAAVASSQTVLPTDGVQQYCAYAASTGWKPEYYDIGSCIFRWAPDDYANRLAALDAAVPFRYFTESWLTSYSSVFEARMTDSEHYAGLSVYVPVAERDAENAAWREFEWYGAAGFALDK